MLGVETPQISWLLVAIQLLGLSIAWLVRLGEGSPHQSSLQLLFFAFLTLVGGATIATLGLGPGRWLACGVTLTLMVLTVTWDSRRSSGDAVW